MENENMGFRMDAPAANFGAKTEWGGLLGSAKETPSNDGATPGGGAERQAAPTVPQPFSPAFSPPPVRQFAQPGGSGNAFSGILGSVFGVPPDGEQARESEKPAVPPMGDALRLQYKQVLDAAKEAANLRMRGLGAQPAPPPQTQIAPPAPQFQVAIGRTAVFGGGADANYVTVDGVDFGLGGVDTNDSAAVGKAVSDEQRVYREMANWYEND